MKKYNYFYKITNLTNNYFYFGIHKTDNLEDNYMGSSKILNSDIEKYGEENFKKEILEFFNTYEDAFNYESKIVNEELIKLDFCYNLKKGGQGGWDYCNENRNEKERNKDYYKTKKGIEHLSKAGSWDNIEKRREILNSIPMEKRKEIGKNLGDKFGGHNKLIKDEINKRLKLIKDVDMNKYGWVVKVSKILNISHTQTKRFIDKHYKGTFKRRT